MLKVNSDRAWKKFGQKNPYYGVLTNEKYFDENLTPEQKEIFFKTGETHVNNVMNLINDNLRPGFKPQTVLDFGCGTGRLVIPFSSKSEKTIGVDVSEEMLMIAQNNCKERGVTNAEFVLSDPKLLDIDNNSIDLAHSHIVFQHISVKKGERILTSLLSKMKSHGIGVLQITYFSDRPTTYQIINYINNRFPFLNNFINLIRGLPFGLPLIQMNTYSLSKIFSILQKNGIKKVQSFLSEQHQMHSVILLFEKEG